jgi:hypothetical protein
MTKIQFVLYLIQFVTYFVLHKIGHTKKKIRSEKNWSPFILRYVGIC